jgi:phage gp37-like protein
VSLTDDKAGEALRLAATTGGFKDRVEMAAAQYLGPVHKLWTEGQKAATYFASVEFSAKAKVSHFPRPLRQGVVIHHIMHVPIFRTRPWRCWSSP